MSCFCLKQTPFFSKRQDLKLWSSSSFWLLPRELSASCVILVLLYGVVDLLLNQWARSKQGQQFVNFFKFSRILARDHRLYRRLNLFQVFKFAQGFCWASKVLFFPQKQVFLSPWVLLNVWHTRLASLDFLNVCEPSIRLFVWVGKVQYRCGSPFSGAEPSAHRLFRGSALCVTVVTPKDTLAVLQVQL